MDADGSAEYSWFEVRDGSAQGGAHVRLKDRNEPQRFTTGQLYKMLTVDVRSLCSETVIAPCKQISRCKDFTRRTCAFHLQAQHAKDEKTA